MRSQLHLQQHRFDLKSVLQCTTSHLSNLFQQDLTQWRNSADQYRKRHGTSHYKPHAKAFVFSSIREIRDSMYAKMNCGRGNPRSQTTVTSGNSSRNGILTAWHTCRHGTETLQHGSSAPTTSRPRDCGRLGEPKGLWLQALRRVWKTWPIPARCLELKQGPCFGYYRTSIIVHALDHSSELENPRRPTEASTISFRPDPQRIPIWFFPNTMIASGLGWEWLSAPTCSIKAGALMTCCTLREIMQNQ